MQKVVDYDNENYANMQCVFFFSLNRIYAAKHLCLILSYCTFWHDVEMRNRTMEETKKNEFRFLPRR